MAELRYDIYNDRWAKDYSYTVVYYDVSYDPVKNESTVTISETLMRIWGLKDTNSSGTTKVTVTATDSGASGSTSASMSD
jgi:hypothetical protein